MHKADHTISDGVTDEITTEYSINLRFAIDESFWKTGPNGVCLVTVRFDIKDLGCVTVFWICRIRTTIDYFLSSAFNSFHDNLNLRLQCLVWEMM